MNQENINREEIKKIKEELVKQKQRLFKLEIEVKNIKEKLDIVKIAEQLNELSLITKGRAI